LRVIRKGLEDQLDAIHREAGDQPLNSKQQGRWNRIQAEIRKMDADIEEAELIEERAENVRKSRAKWGSLSVGGVTGGSADPWSEIDLRAESPAGLQTRAHEVLRHAEDLSHDGREALAGAIDSDEGAAASAMVLARSNPAYASAFAKVLKNPDRALLGLNPDEMRAVAMVESVRATMATTTGTAGYLLPLSLDPLVIVANDGQANPFRKVAKVKAVASSPHRTVKSAGVTAEWSEEGAAIADASPSIVPVDIPLYKLAAFITATFELVQDSAADLFQTLGELLLDARDRAEADAFAVGSGSGAPTGVLTALASASAFVTATTRGTFTSESAGDTLALLNALPPRARQNKTRTAWVMNNDILSIIRQQTIGTAGAMLTELNNDGTLLGHPVFEASAMGSATTSGSYLAVLADMSKYVILDHVSGPSMEFVQLVFDGDGAILGKRGWVFHHRVGADYVDALQGRVLKA
jgi:HK97 family phage major capsid protein